MKQASIALFTLIMFLILGGVVRDYMKLPIMEVDHATKRCVSVRLPPDYEAQPCAGQLPDKFEIVWVSRTDPE